VPLSPGATLGPYEIVSLIGEGGMGAVYKARDPRLDRFVAIKVLTADSAADGERQQRFAHEARAASALNHPNIVTVHYTGTEAGAIYIAMELVSGRTLADLIPSHGLPLSQVFGWATQMADGLARAHKAGLVHRDLKPGNVMVDDDGRIRILDFGLAKTVDARGPAGRGSDQPTLTSPPLTDAGIVMGTVAYMSPEQAEGRAVDARSDIFSFGVVLYEMISGRKPFAGDSRMGTISAILRDVPPPLSQSIGGVPAELDRLIDRCLRKDPDRRWQHMTDLRNALLDLKEDSDSGRLAARAPAAVPAVRSVSRRWLVAGATLFVILAGVAWFAFGRPQPAVAPATELIPVPLTTYPGDERDPTFSADGSQVAFSWSRAGEPPNLWLKLVGPTDPIRLTTSATERHIMAQWSPDGQWIAFMAADVKTSVRRTMVIPALGQGVPRAVASGPGRGTWTPDSRGLVVPDKDGLFLYPLDGGERRPIAVSVDGVGFGPGQISPDGRWIAVTVPTGLALLALDAAYRASGSPRPLTPDGWGISSFDWTPDSAEIVFIRSLQAASANIGAETAMYRVGVDGSEPRRIASVGSNPWFLDVARQGDRLAFTRLRRDVNLYVAELGPDGRLTGREQTLAPSSLLDESPSFDRTGSLVVFTSNRDGSLQIYSVRRDGSRLTRVTRPETGSGAPNRARLSPDGTRVAFQVPSERGSVEVYVVPSVGGQARAVTSGGGSWPSWSADGNWIYYVDARSAIWRAPADGGAAIAVTATAGLRPVESRDGKWLYFLCQPGNVCRVPIEGGDVSRLMPEAVRDRMAGLDVTDLGVYYMTIAQETGAAVVDVGLWRLPLGGGQPASLGVLRGATGSGFSIGAGDREVLYTRCDVCDADIMLVNGFR
jgi:Tol biopolymer transport system component/tRNA A-37 threonylcarbamoyl transferase component Bud32